MEENNELQQQAVEQPEQGQPSGKLASYIITLLALLLLGFLIFLQHQISSNKVALNPIPEMDRLQLPWDPIDWFTLNKNPLLYKEFDEKLIEQGYYYKYYILHPDKLGINVDQKYFNNALPLIRKAYVNKLDDRIVISCVNAEIAKLVKEIHNTLPKQKDLKFQEFNATTVDNNFFPKLCEMWKGKIDKRVLGQAAITGLFKATGDPHTYALSKKNLESMMESLEDKSFGGIGIYMEQEVGKSLMVVEPLEGTPAYKAGILAGDYITHVDGHPTKQEDIDVTMARIRGPKGSKVKLDVSRGHKKLVFNVIRDNIQTQSVSSKMVADRIGYIRIRQFSTGTVDEFIKAMANLSVTHNMKGLIIDLRNNSGGVLESGLTMSGIFLKPHSTIIKKVDRDRFIKSFNGGIVTDDNYYPKLILLVNEFSASASEIMAVALKENKAALLVGEKTFGKGSVQQIFPQKDQSAIKVTIAYFISPKGNIINKKGVTPDYRVEMKPKLVGKDKDIQLQEAIKIMRKLI